MRSRKILCRLQLHLSTKPASHIYDLIVVLVVAVADMLEAGL